MATYYSVLSQAACPIYHCCRLFSHITQRAANTPNRGSSYKVSGNITSCTATLHPTSRWVVVTVLLASPDLGTQQV